MNECVRLQTIRNIRPVYCYVGKRQKMTADHDESWMGNYRATSISQSLDFERVNDSLRRDTKTMEMALKSWRSNGNSK